MVTGDIVLEVTRMDIFGYWLFQALGLHLEEEHEGEERECRGREPLSKQRWSDRNE